jgi:hypothetical protein
MNRKIIALLAIVALLAAYYASQAAPHKSTLAAPVTLQSSINRPGPASYSRAAHSVLGAPSISAKFIDNVLCQASSPACGTGQALYDDGVQSGINPAYALAFFRHESSFGKYGVASTNKGIGNIRCTPGYSCLYGFRKYATWQSGYKDWYVLIAWYASDLHKSTVETIIPTYAPSVENDVTAYINSVESSVDAWQRGTL